MSSEQSLSFERFEASLREAMDKTASIVAIATLQASAACDNQTVCS